MWTHSQRRALLVLCLVLGCLLVVESHLRPAEISDPVANSINRSGEILDQIDPNTADASALAAIPNLGEKRAAEIVEYRELFLLQHHNGRPFRSVGDMIMIKGIGPATAAALAAFLTFDPTEQSRPQN